MAEPSMESVIEMIVNITDTLAKANNNVERLMQDREDLIAALNLVSEVSCPFGDSCNHQDCLYLIHPGPPTIVKNSATTFAKVKNFGTKFTTCVGTKGVVIKKYTPKTKTKTTEVVVPTAETKPYMPKTKTTEVVVPTSETKTETANPGNRTQNCWKLKNKGSATAATAVAATTAVPEASNRARTLSWGQEANEDLFPPKITPKKPW